MLTKQDFLRIRGIEEVKELTPREFEYFSKFLLEYLGYKKVRVTPKKGYYGSDGGIDVVCEYENQKVHVQSKKWNIASHKRDYVPVKEIRELGGCMYRDKVKKGVFISTLQFHQKAKKEAKQMNIELIDDSDIEKVLHIMHPKPKQQETKNVPVDREVQEIYSDSVSHAQGTNEDYSFANYKPTKNYIRINKTVFIVICIILLMIFFGSL